ncbi:MAG TPA: flagellar biosynthetic protein FliR [Chthoniobacterales bacterium]
MQISFDLLYTGMMVFIRAGGLLALLPVFSGQSVPVQIRLAIAVLLAYLAGAQAQPTSAIPDSMLALITIAVRELFIGLLMGFAIRLIFYAIEFAGQVMSTEIGLTVSSQIDPISRQTSSPVGTALFYLGSLLFLISGCHHAVFLAFLRSFQIAPVGAIAFHRDTAEALVSASGNIFLVALQMAAPLLAVNFVVTFAFAILGKAAPSINVFSESFSVRVLVGIAILGLTLGLTAQAVLSALRGSPEMMLRVIP